MFYDCYTALCQARGISRSRAAQEMGLSNSTVTKWKNTGATPSGETLARVSAYFGRAGGGGCWAKPSRRCRRSGSCPKELSRSIPLSRLRCWARCVRACPCMRKKTLRATSPSPGRTGARYFWLRVRGDSMNAVGISENDEILVREQPEVENGQLAVVMVNGDEATVKYFRQEGSLVVLTPKSFNPVHQPQIYDLKRVQVRVVGLVVECRKVF